MRERSNMIEPLTCPERQRQGFRCHYADNAPLGKRDLLDSAMRALVVSIERHIRGIRRTSSTAWRLPMRSRLSTICVLGIALLSGAAGLVSAQQLGDKKTLETNFNNAAKNQFKKLSDGDEQPSKADQKIAEAAAQYYIYRITH